MSAWRLEYDSRRNAENSIDGINGRWDKDTLVGGVHLLLRKQTFVSWESHVALQISILRAPRTYTMRIVCILRNFPLAKTETKVVCQNWTTQQEPQEEALREARRQYSKSVWTHENSELCEASAAAKDFIGKHVKLATPDLALLRARTVPIVLHVAKDESHVGA